MPPDKRIAVETNWEKFTDQAFFGWNFKEVWKNIYFSKIIFLKTFHGYLDCGFRKSGENFR